MLELYFNLIYWPTKGLRPFQAVEVQWTSSRSYSLRRSPIFRYFYGKYALSRPVIGIINTGSGLQPFRGVQLNGGLPIEFPTISLHESFASPTSMYLRNLLSIDTEEMIKAQPLDACSVVSTQIMGGISANKPILPLVTGPMMPGSYRGTRIGACTDCRRVFIDIEDIAALNDELAPTSGTCGVMGTASTMACITAALGASAPAVSAARLRVAEETGKNAVAAVSNALHPQTILTKESFLNAITVLQAIGGSTNGVVHLMGNGKQTSERRCGDNYMSDFHNAGGMTALLQTLRPLLFLSARTMTGQSLGEVLDAAVAHDFPYSQEIIRPLSNPLYPCSSIVVLRGNLAPGGAVIKASASKDRRLLNHVGPAVVFSDTADLARRIDDPELPVTADSVLVLKGIGPIGHPGMPEAGLIPIPRKLGAAGVQDMLRLSDGRMSGTAGGTIVLHISPESVLSASVFGVVQDGDLIKCDVENRVLHLDVSDDEIARRIAERIKKRGYRGLYERSVNQAEHGVDFDFLTASGPA
ncbi:putative dehydratase [Favolaschia claudopus]|uniref:Dehydratase n=1 Tax=Favolaschia claudopus TaxID=2862362 RepID=A0AAW0BC33_9AGAR